MRSLEEKEKFFLLSEAIGLALKIKAFIHSTSIQCSWCLKCISDQTDKIFCPHEPNILKEGGDKQ